MDTQLVSLCCTRLPRRLGVRSRFDWRSRLLPAVLLASMLGGCAVGNTYEYRLPRLPLSVQGNSAIGLAVTDQRPYILDGDKDPNFVGLQRGGYGNPFDVTTASGRPMAEDMALSSRQMARSSPGMPFAAPMPSAAACRGRSGRWPSRPSRARSASCSTRRTFAPPWPTRGSRARRPRRPRTPAASPHLGARQPKTCAFCWAMARAS